MALKVSISPASRILVIGDSITETFGDSFSWWWSFGQLVRAHYVPTITPLDWTNPKSTANNKQQWPRTYVNAAAGRKVGDISGAIAATLALYPGIDTVIFQLGVNDAFAILGGSLSIGTFDTEVDTCLAAVAGAGITKVGWIGGWQHGSPPDMDTQIALVNSHLAAKMATVGAFVDWHADVPGGAGNTIDFTHPNQTGAALLAADVVTAVQFQ